MIAERPLVPTVKTVTVSGGNLFRVAQEHLGSALQWHRIAALNGLSDPWITGTVTLFVPQPDREGDRDGIGNV